MAGPAVEPAPGTAPSDRPVLPEGLVFADAFSRFAAYLLDPQLAMLTPQCQPLRRTHVLLARLAIQQKQRVHPRHHLNRRAVLRIHLHGVYKLAPCVCPDAYVHEPRPAHSFVS